MDGGVGDGPLGRSADLLGADRRPQHAAPTPPPRAYQNQLDQVAAGLVSAFSESDQTGSGAPTQAGLFTSTSLSGGLPTPATTAGLAASLAVNSSVDPTAGGAATLLRDGNISSSNAAYTYNTTGADGFSARLQALSSALGQTRSFDATTGW